MRIWLTFVPAALLILSGCQRENTRVINERRAAVSAKLDQIQALRTGLASIPPETEDSLRLGDGALVMSAYPMTGLPTGTVAYAHTLEDLRARHDGGPHYALRLKYGALLEDCGALLAKGGFGPAYDAVNTPANSAKATLDACANLRYVFVLRTEKMGDGEFVGDAVAFDLTTGKRIGGFPLDVFSAGRTDTVSTTTTTRGRSGRRGRPSNSPTKRETVTRNVNADLDQLVRDVAEEIVARIKQLAPAAQVLD